MTAQERKAALLRHRSGSDARIARRTQVLRLLTAGRSRREIMGIDFASSNLVADLKSGFLEGGLEAALAKRTDEEAAPHCQLVAAG